MSDKFFLDTNVLVYAHDHADSAKQARAAELVLQGLSRDLSVISAQVLGEFFVTVTTKLKVPLGTEEAVRAVRALSIMPVCPLDRALVLLALDIRGRYQLSYWDSLIIAAARAGGCGILYSEDLAHGADYLQVRVENPFLQG